MRGPTGCQASKARFKPTSMKCGTPAVRMPTTPAFRSPCLALKPYWMACSGSVGVTRRGHSRCTCTSHSPGNRYEPCKSITWAPRVAGERPPPNTSTIRPSSTVTLAPDIGSGLLQSIRCALVRTSVIGHILCHFTHPPPARGEGAHAPYASRVPTGIGGGGVGVKAWLLSPLSLLASSRLNDQLCLRDDGDQVSSLQRDACLPDHGATTAVQG